MVKIKIGISVEKSLKTLADARVLVYIDERVIKVKIPILQKAVNSLL
jgi:hypothetical protein